MWKLLNRIIGANCSLIIMCFCGFGMSSIYAQQIEVKGQITDPNGIPVTGVNILQKSTNNGVMTDFDGNYTIKLIEGLKILVYSSLGFKTIEKEITEDAIINIKLIEDLALLDEVVLIGYGSEKKENLSGSVVSIRTEELLSNSPTTIVQGLQGKLAGVQITSNSGAPGAGSSISIRGVNSISAGTEPLYVVDGVPFDFSSDEISSSTVGSGNSMSPLDAINPADIKSISVMKDASATAIYGSRGANGVIIIETIKGNSSSGKGVISFNTYTSLSGVSRVLPVLNGNEFIEYRRDVDPEGILFFVNRDVNQPRDPYALKQHDWQDEILRTGFTDNYDISLRGSGDKTDYSVNLGALNSKAVVRENDQQRYSFRLNLDHRRSDKLLLGVNTNASYSEYSGASHSGGGDELFNGIVQNLVISMPVELYNPSFAVGDTYISPSSMLDDTYNNTANSTFGLNAFMHYGIGDNFRLIVSGSGNISNSKGSQFFGKNTSWGFGSNGKGSLDERKAISINGSAQLHYFKTINEKHNIKAFVATETNKYIYEWFGITKTNFLNESTGIFDISQGSVLSSSGSYKDVTNRASFFGRVNYSYNDRHLFTLTYRADGSDKFGEGNRFGFFPSAAYSWVILNDKFRNGDSMVSLAKLRLSYGVTGNDRISSHRYLARLENTYYDGELGFAPSSQANPDLQWETTYQTNIGFDFGFFDNAITGSIDLYKKETHDLLMPVPVPGRTGYSTQWSNIGRIDNQGIEFQLSTININSDKFKWTTDFNVSTNKNEIIKLSNVDFIPVSIPGGWIQDISRLTAGRSIGEAYGYEFDGVYQIDDFTWQNDNDASIPHSQRDYILKSDVVSVSGVNVKPGSHKFKDLNGDNVIKLDDDRKHISRSDPILFGGITNSFKYKNFDLNIFFQGSYGNEIFNESKYRLEGGVSNAYMNVTQNFFYNHWSPDNPTNEYGDYAGRNVTSLLASSYYVEDASYLRLSSLSVGYNFSDTMLEDLKIGSARIYVTGNNLYTWTKYTGYDPELNSGDKLMTGVDRISYPRTTSIILGLNLSF